jgi:hypothetical protein
MQPGVVAVGYGVRLLPLHVGEDQVSGIAGFDLRSSISFTARKLNVALFAAK